MKQISFSQLTAVVAACGCSAAANGGTPAITSDADIEARVSKIVSQM